MTVPANIEAKRSHAVVHFGLSIIIAIPIIGTLLGFGAIFILAIAIFVKSSDRLRDWGFLLAYPIVFLLVLGTVTWIAEFFSRDTFTTAFIGCAATVPVSFYFIHKISGRIGEY